MRVSYFKAIDRVWMERHAEKNISDITTCATSILRGILILLVDVMHIPEEKPLEVSSKKSVFV
jgi:hypothetical protein